MWNDVVDLSAFYASPLGQTARHAIGVQLREIWPDLQGRQLLGLGYATPYLSSFRTEAALSIAAMPAGQGALPWPHGARGLTLLADETTLPLRHTMAPSDMTVPAERLDKEFFDLAEAEGVTDIDELNRVLDRAVGLRTFLTADDRVEKVAAFVAEHFKESVLPLGYKAFLVGVNREACAKYKRALDKLLPPEWSEAVYTENAADVIDRPLVAQQRVQGRASRSHCSAR